MYQKSLLHNTIFISLGFMLGYYIIFGSNGIASYCRICQKVNKEQAEINRLNDEITSLKSRIALYCNEPFEMEKIARYDLCMGYTNELVYILPPSQKI